MKVLLSSVALLAASVCIAGEGSPSRTPVLVELFTSEGCSSCPPADRLLEKLDREQSAPGAELIVLSEHVDYWNQLGWRDPFSSSLFSQRQREYADRLNGEVYTPEMVIDGAKGFVGSDEREARQAIREAVKAQKSPVRMTAERIDGKVKISIHMDDAPDGALYLALAHDSMSSQVLRGENAGRGLSHVAVVYSIEKLGKLDRHAGPFDRDVTVSIKPGEKTRIVAFVEKAGVGRVTAVGQARL
jgi:hypothetical protein